MKSEIFELSEENWFISLPQFASLVLRALNLDRSLEIINRWFVFVGKRKYTQQEIGNYYGISRQRVQQHIQKGLVRIWQALSGELEAPEFIVKKLIRDEVQEIKQSLSEQILVTEGDVIGLLGSKGQIVIDYKVLDFLLELFQFEKSADNIPQSKIELVPFWITSAEKFDKRLFYKKAKEVYKFLQKAGVREDTFEIIANINQNGFVLTPSDLDQIGNLLPAIQKVGENQYQMEFFHLSSIATKAFRVLYETGEPIHIRDIARMINQRLADSAVPKSNFVKLRSLQQQLVDDPRFKPLGRGGYWKLTEWTRIISATIIEIMRNCLYQFNKALTPAEIFEYVVERRSDISPRSINIYLRSREDVFTQTEKGKFALSDWGGKPFNKDKRKPREAKKPTKRHQIQQQVFLELRSAPSSEISLLDLRETIVKRIKCSPTTVYRYLTEMEETGQILKTSYGKHKKVMLLRSDSFRAEDYNLEKIIADGETESVEFKEGAFWNEYQNKKDDNMRNQVVKGVASFLNSQRGILLIGVKDDGKVVGIEREYPYADVQKKNKDGYELNLRQALTSKLGLKAMPHITFRFEKVLDTVIYCLIVFPSPRPVYVDGELIIRNGNQTKRLNAEEVSWYIPKHWPNYS